MRPPRQPLQPGALLRVASDRLADESRDCTGWQVLFVRTQQDCLPVVVLHDGQEFAFEWRELERI